MHYYNIYRFAHYRFLLRLKYVSLFDASNKKILLESKTAGLLSLNLSPRTRESFQASLYPTIDLHGVTVQIYGAYLYAGGDN